MDFEGRVSNLDIDECVPNSSNGDDSNVQIEIPNSEVELDVNKEPPSCVTINEPNEVVPQDGTGGLSLILNQTPDETGKSVKDRMFLSSDDASCLLFTQTVTSPMLTPSEENIDFLKGFKCETNEDEDTSQINLENVQNEQVYIQNEIEEVENELDSANNLNIQNDFENYLAEENTFEETNEQIYENYEMIENNQQENIYENLKFVHRETINEIENSETSENNEIIENGDRIRMNGTIENNEIIENGEIINECLNYETIKKIDRTNENGDDSHKSNVEILKSQFLNDNNDVSTATPKTIKQNHQLKCYDITKQINKFENSVTPNNEDSTNNCSELVSFSFVFSI